MSFMENAAKPADITRGATGEQAAVSYGQTQDALQQQQAFVNALQAQNGIQNQSNVYNSLGQIASGQGPNPAQAQLAQATQANVANQAAQAAGQRGASQNVGMIARQAGQQGAAIQQQAAGQGASMAAQQQMNALGQQANIAGQQVGQQAQATAGYNNASQGQQQNVLGGISSYNNASVASQNSVNQGAMAAQQAMTGAVMGGISAVGTGGTSLLMADGGQVPSPTPFHDYFNQAMSGGGSVGQVDAILSPGEAYIPPSEVESVAKKEKSPSQAGEIIQGQAKVKGDSLKNDTVPKKLEVGGVVIPRSKMGNEDSAAKFVQALMFKSKGGKK